MSATTSPGIDALAALAAICGNAASAVAAKNSKNNDGGDKTQGSGESTAAPTPHTAYGNIPASVGPNVSGLLALYQQQQQGQHQYFQQQATGLQQADAVRASQALSSMPPHPLQAYLCSQPKIGQALQAALAAAGGGGGGGQYVAAPLPATASLSAAFPGLAASADQQQQQAAQLQMIAAQLFSAASAAENGQMPPRPQPQLAAKPTVNVSEETSLASSPSSKRAATLPPKKRASKKPKTTTSSGGVTAVIPTAAATASSSRPSSKTIIAEWEDKKLAKAAANRLSAHLSRTRKKVFVDDLKAENMELRRKNMILRSIPDHIVAFDSTGCVSFVSQSFNRALDFSSDELENTSFWDLLTDDSVRVMKSAFMDALAVKRKPEDDTTPLADGESISVRIIDKYGSKEKEGLPFSLKGVVHFAADSPECICTLCPEPTSSKSDLVIDNAKTKQVSDGSQ